MFRINKKVKKNGELVMIGDDLYIVVVKDDLTLELRKLRSLKPIKATQTYKCKIDFNTPFIDKTKVG